MTFYISFIIYSARGHLRGIFRVADVFGLMQHEQWKKEPRMGPQK